MIPHHIGGQRMEGAAERRGQVYNPASGAVLAQVPFAGESEVDLAVQAAGRAQPLWANFSLSRRTEVLFAFRELLRSHRQELAREITAQHGKVLSDAQGEVARGIENVEYACGLASHLRGGHSEEVSTGVDVYEVLQPLGVAAGISPFNFPVMVPLWMLANAIACGNGFVLKPSEKDPGPSLMLAELFEQAGLPPGVLNVVQGDQAAVQRLLHHPQVAAVSFVGSTRVAREIYRVAAEQGKRVQALGGAKNHMVVLPDAELGAAADAAVSAAYGSAGERCMAVSVVVAVGAVADPLAQAIKERIEKLRIGPGDEESSEMGPLVTREHRDRVAAYIDRGLAEGATVVVDGRRQHFDSEGFFLGASLLDQVQEGMAVYQDEIFGPVLSIVRASSFEEALEVVNRNQYGNGAAIFTKDGGAARRFTREVAAGMVGVNVPIPVPVGYYSFGGWKDSLFGSGHIYGPAGIDFYTRAKVVTSRWPEPSRSRVDLGFPETR
ncbi:MAG: CoA-acylating methylmalonate-semialdehyde dehydrogenase [Candidatus Dormibacteria bacterium]